MDDNESSNEHSPRISDWCGKEVHKVEQPRRALPTETIRSSGRMQRPSCFEANEDKSWNYWSERVQEAYESEEPDPEKRGKPLVSGVYATYDLGSQSASTLSNRSEGSYGLGQVSQRVTSGGSQQRDRPSFLDSPALSTLMRKRC